MEQRQKVSTKAFILNNENKVLLVKRADEDTYLPGLWELPGGSTEFSEDPNLGVIREVLEECGVQVRVDWPLFVKDFLMYENKHIVEIIFSATLLDDAQEVSLSAEHSTYAWVDRSEMEAYNFDEYMIDIVNRCFAHPLIKAR